MLRRLRFVLFVALGAVAGALMGRLAAEFRRRTEAGEDPLDIDITQLTLRPSDLVPGFVAAFRVRDAPWSWLHIPSWLAAFGVNLGVAAVGGDLGRLREMAERAAFGMAGIEFPGPSDEADDIAPSPFDTAADAASSPPPPYTPWAPPPGSAPYRG